MGLQQPSLQRRQLRLPLRDTLPLHSPSLNNNDNNRGGDGGGAVG